MTVARSRRGRWPAAPAAALVWLLTQATLPLPGSVPGVGGSVVAAQEARPAPPAPAPPAAPAETGAPRSIEDGATVQIEYTLKDDAGAVLDSNSGQEPLTYVHGQHQIVPGLEQALGGMREGDRRSVTIPPSAGYGPTNPSALVEVPRQSIPPDALVAGTWLSAQRQDGASATLVRVKEVREETVILDLNHPLAGQTLHFDVKILGVVPPAKP